VEVPELAAWVARSESVLGPGFAREVVRQRTGEVHVAIHPAGLELLENRGAQARLRSFHLRSADLETSPQRAREAGWKELDRFRAEGRRHVVFEVGGLRVCLLEAREGEAAGRSGGNRKPSQG
ncbi:MAG: hypothetical protein ACRDKW_07660, partial [Actinomycetota bacterium]